MKITHMEQLCKLYCAQTICCKNWSKCEHYLLWKQEQENLPLGGMECPNCNNNVLLDAKGICPTCGENNLERF